MNSFFFPLYRSKTIACRSCGIALHVSVSTVQTHGSPLQQCVVGWGSASFKDAGGLHSSTTARWYQLHHNFITSSSLCILLTLTFYRDWQHAGREAWHCQRLNPFSLSPYSRAAPNTLLFVVFVQTNDADCDGCLQLQWDYTDGD